MSYASPLPHPVNNHLANLEGFSAPLERSGLIVGDGLVRRGGPGVAFTRLSVRSLSRNRLAAQRLFPILYLFALFATLSASNLGINVDGI